MNTFRRQPQPDADGYYVAATAAEVWPDEMTSVEIGNHALILTRWRGEIYAFSRHCPHAAGDLRQGRVAKGQISCPDHGYYFDLRSGLPTWPEDEVCRLKRYVVKEENGFILVKLN